MYADEKIDKGLIFDNFIKNQKLLTDINAWRDMFFLTLLLQLTHTWFLLTMIHTSLS